MDSKVCLDNEEMKALVGRYGLPSILDLTGAGEFQPFSGLETPESQQGFIHMVVVLNEFLFSPVRKGTLFHEVHILEKENNFRIFYGSRFKGTGTPPDCHPEEEVRIKLYLLEYFSWALDATIETINNEEAS